MLNFVGYNYNMIIIYSLKYMHTFSITIFRVLLVTLDVLFMQTGLLRTLGVQGALFDDDNSPINMFKTQHRAIMN